MNPLDSAGKMSVVITFDPITKIVHLASNTDDFPTQMMLLEMARTNLLVKLMKKTQEQDISIVHKPLSAIS